MFEYKVDNITIYNNTAFDIKSEKHSNIESKIALWIVKCFEKDILSEILDGNYEGFNKFDKERIIENAQKALESSSERRRKYIEKSLKEYFAQEKMINIPGFVRFRLKDYKRGLERVLDKIIDKYICEKEYYEFLEMIKEYIKFQTPMFSLLHIVTEEDCIKYYDRYLTELTEMLEREYSFETDLSTDDKLLTILVLSAPEKIIWHNSHKSKNKELKTTLSEIFGNRLILCDECKFCGNNIENSIDKF